MNLISIWRNARFFILNKIISYILYLYLAYILFGKHPFYGLIFLYIVTLTCQTSFSWIYENKLFLYLATKQLMQINIDFMICMCLSRGPISIPRNIKYIISSKEYIKQLTHDGDQYHKWTGIIKCYGSRVILMKLLFMHILLFLLLYCIRQNRVIKLVFPHWSKKTPLPKLHQ